MGAVHAAQRRRVAAVPGRLRRRRRPRWPGRVALVRRTRALRPVVSVHCWSVDSRRGLGLALLLAASSTAHADPPTTSDQTDRDREWVALRIVAEGATYLTLEFGLN